MKLFVWDFHGVLEKGNDNAVLEITNRALEFHGYARRMTKDESELLSGLRWHEYFSFLIAGLEKEQCFQLQATCFDISQSQPEILVRHIQLNDHVDHVLETIQNSQNSQILISNTPAQSLEMFVNLVGIDKYFPATHRFGVDSHHQNKLTKKDCLNEFIKNKSLFKSIISIGDSPGDMDLIHQDKIKGIGYLYSHPTKKHRPAQCHYKINDLRLVLQEVT